MTKREMQIINMLNATLDFKGYVIDDEFFEPILLDMTSAEICHVYDYLEWNRYIFIPVNYDKVSTAYYIMRGEF